MPPWVKGLPVHNAGVVDEILGGEIVRAVHDKVVFSDNIQDIICSKVLMTGVDADMRIYLPQLLFGGIHLAASYIWREVYHLALQVGKLHRVTVRNAERPRTGSRQIEGDR